VFAEILSPSTSAATTPTAILGAGHLVKGQSTDSVVALVVPTGGAPSVYWKPDSSFVAATGTQPPSVTLLPLATIEASAGPVMTQARIEVAKLLGDEQGCVVTLLPDGELDVYQGSMLDAGANDANQAPLFSATNVGDFALMPRVGETGEYDLVYTTKSVTPLHYWSRESTAQSIDLDVPIHDDATGAVAVGDFNGDRLPDVAIATTDGIEIFYRAAAP
jgi:hypothetical protein